MRKIQLSKRKHRFWIHNIIKKRKRFGVFYHLVKELQLDQNKYMEYFRISQTNGAGFWLCGSVDFQTILNQRRYRCKTETCDMYKVCSATILRFYQTRRIFQNMSWTETIKLCLVYSLLVWFPWFWKISLFQNLLIVNAARFKCYMTALK